MVTIVGLDYSGKTTLLYLLKLGQIVPTTSSFGFNVETVDIPISSSKRFRMTGWDIGTGCGGLQYLYGTVRFYLEMSSALVWVVDSCDRNRLPESINSLSRVLSNMDAGATKDKIHSKLKPILM